MKAYQLELPDVAVISEILSEVEVFHELKNERKWVLPSGINPDERHYMMVREASAYQHFMAKPLSVGCQ